MSIQELKRRLARLEQDAQFDQVIVLVFLDGRQKQRPAGSRDFERLAEALSEPAKNPPDTRAQAYLEDLRRATEIKGPHSQRFALLRALALGPEGD